MAVLTKEWKQTEATVESSSQHHCNIATGGGFVGQEYAIKFRYEVDGRRYNGEFECTRPWEVGSTFCISYDPAEPEINTMCNRREERWVYTVLGILAVLAFVAYFWVRHQRIGY